jgi:hypothetical protein
MGLVVKTLISGKVEEGIQVEDISNFISQIIHIPVLKVMYLNIS